MTVALWKYWHELDRLPEAQHWVDRALAECGRTGEDRSELLRASAILAHERGDFQATAAVGKLLVENAERSGDPGEIGRALVVLATAKYELGRGDEAEADFNRALACFRQSEDRRRTATTLESLGLLAAELRDDRVAARRYLEESRDTLGEFGPSLHLGAVIANLGYLTFLDGDIAGAIELARESLGVVEELGVATHVAWQLITIAGYHVRRGEFAAASESLRRAWREMEKQPNRVNRVHYFDIAFRLAVATGKYELAARIHGFLEGYRERTHTRRAPSERQSYAKSYAQLEQSLDRERLSALVSAGANEEASVLRAEM